MKKFVLPTIVTSFFNHGFGAFEYGQCHGMLLLDGGAAIRPDHTDTNCTDKMANSIEPAKTKSFIFPKKNSKFLTFFCFLRTTAENLG